MRALALFVLMLLCAPVSAGIASNMSGLYLASDRVCDVVFKRYTGVWDGVPVTVWTQVEFDCRLFAGGDRQRSLTTLYAPGDPCQGVNQVAWSLAPYLANGEYVRFPTGSGEQLDAVLGTDAQLVANGIGRRETWLRLFPIESPAPYSCAAPARKG